MDPDEPLFLDDPVLRHLAPFWIPQAFQRLPPAEQRWRGRVFLIVLILTGGGQPFSWATAMGDDPDHVAECQQIVADTPDEVIVEGLEWLADEQVRRRLESVPG